MILTIFTGCWDKTELNEIAIILGTSIDKDNTTGKYLVNVQAVRPSALGNEKNQNESPIEMISAEGDTIFEAVRNISQEFDRNCFFSHNKIIIISEEIAKNGIDTEIDFFMRTQEVRKNNWLIIAKGTEAKKILEVLKGINSIQANYLISIIKRRVLNSNVNVPSLLDIIKAASNEGVNATAGVMEVIEEKQNENAIRKQNTNLGIKLTGTAVFDDKNKLLGYFNDEKTRGLNWVVNKIDSGVVIVTDPKNKDKLISIEIKGSSCRIIPQVNGDKYKFIIKVKAYGNIVETEGKSDVFNVDVFYKIQKKYKEAIKEEIKSSIDVLQKKYNSDIIGFGKTLSKHNPKEWKKVKNKWKKIFCDVKYEVEVDANLKQSGLIKKQIELK